MGNFRHGMAETKTYKAWASMRQRCENPKKHNYHNYGGRGVRVCERWQDFKNFLADMGEAPAGYSIERIDVNGDYCPENCKWIPFHEQTRNRRVTLRATVNGVEVTMKEACEKLGLNYRTVQSRINIMGWTKEEALGLCTKKAHRPRPVSRHSLQEARKSGSPSWTRTSADTD